jgi:hypothetical protein
VDPERVEILNRINRGSRRAGRLVREAEQVTNEKNVPNPHQTHSCPILDLTGTLRILPPLVSGGRITFV